VREAAIERQIDTFAGVGLMAAREATALLSDGSTPADEVVSEHEKEKLVTEVLDKLTPRERRVLELRFGIGGKSDHTLEELGQDFEISRERIRQIEAKALRKLRHPSLADALRDFK
jgi:RNA polymerase primary sigma factor